MLASESRDQRLGEWEATGLTHSETLGDRRGDERRFRDGGERDEDRSIGEFRFQPGGGLEGEPRLADAAGTRQCEQADIRAT